MYKRLRKLKKFTSKEKIDSLIGKPKFQIENRLLFYYGNGVLISYSQKHFYVEGCHRVEYGEEGLFAVSIYHFADINMMKEYFHLKDFEEDDWENIVCDTIDGDISYGKTFADIHELRLDKYNAD